MNIAYQQEMLAIRYFCFPDFYQGHHVLTTTPCAISWPVGRWQHCRLNICKCVVSTNIETEGIWFCITGIHVSTFTGGKKLVESMGACPIVHVREPDYQLCMFPSRWRCPLGESQFCTHASFPEIWGCLYIQEHMFTFSKLSRPLEIKLSRPISYFSEKLYHTYEKIREWRFSAALKPAVYWVGQWREVL